MKRLRVLACLLLASCAGGPSPEFPPPGAATFPDPAGPTAEPAAAAYPEPLALASLFGAEYDRALCAVGLDRRTARCTPQDLSIVGQGKFQTALYQALESDPTLADRYAATLRDGAFASAGTLEGSSLFAAVRIGAGVRLGLLGDPLAKDLAEVEKPGALAAVLHGLGVADPLPSLDAVPPKVQAAAALVLRASIRSRMWLGRAFANCVDPGGIRSREAADATLLLAKDENDDGLRATFEREGEAIDLRYLARAAAEVHLATDRAAAWAAEAKDAGPFEFRCATEAGVVLLRGGGDDSDGTGDGSHYVLRIDTGGNDSYAGGAASAGDCPVSVLIDVAGNDTYNSPADTPAFGAGFLGIGDLVDLAGNDRYFLYGERSLGLGAGVFGVGALLDCGGDDDYVADGFCEGAGAAGWGTLSDLGGHDRYEAYRYAQGFGFVLGAGVLADLAGNDLYAMNDTDIRHGSAQSKEHNDSLGQGFGFGVRADYLDGHSLAGGVGILADREGDDAYSCGVFGQGAGYWMGTGMLLDGGGNDTYAGVWYVQGACARFAVGILDDASGDDRYDALLNMAQGAGHDYSLGVLLDHAGNDRYSAPNLSLGGGNSDGVGLFVDGGGDDVYRSKGTTLGLASMEAQPGTATLRHGSLTLGVFLDLGGNDTYLGPDGNPWPFAGEGRTWTQAERSEKPLYSNQRGVGADAGR